MEESRDEGPPTPRGFGGRARAFARSRSRKQQVGALAAIALLITAPFGGLEAEPDPPPAPLRVGKVVDIGPFDITIEKVVSVEDLKPAVSPRPGDRLLVIEATVRNTTDKPLYRTQIADAFFGSGLGVIPFQGQTRPKPEIHLIADGSVLSGEVNPGIDYHVAAVLEQRGDWAPATPRLGLNRYVFRADDPQTLDPDAWIIDRPVVEGPVHVVVK